MMCIYSKSSIVCMVGYKAAVYFIAVELKYDYQLLLGVRTCDS